MEHKKGSEVRKADYNVSSLFLDRWSPRAMSGETISNEELSILFEAARWAPSSYNEQPWRFIYIKRDSETWTDTLSLLSEMNQLWCKNAAALICIISKKNFTYNNSPNYNHFSDAGAAWENLALQASINNLVAHSMIGFNIAKAKQLFEIPEDYEIVQMTAIGRPADPNVLPPELQKGESPNNRKPIKDLISEDRFRKHLNI